MLPNAVYVTVSLHSGWKKHKLFPALCVLQEGVSLLLFSFILSLSLSLSLSLVGFHSTHMPVCTQMHIYGTFCRSLGLSIFLSAAPSTLLSCCTISSCLSFCELQFLYPQFNVFVMFCWIDLSCTRDWKMPQTVLRLCWNNPIAYFVSILSGITAMCFLCPISKNCSFIYFVFYDKKEHSCSS